MVILKKEFIRYLRLVYFSYKICQKLKPTSILSFPFGWHAFIAFGAKLSRVKKIYVPMWEIIHQLMIKK